MSPEPESARARGYLLGEASEEECSTVEREYFHSDDAVDRIAAAEDDLIEDYLSNRLDAAGRTRFERAYLAVPHRRQRVETIRQLMTAASRPAARQAASPELPVPVSFRLQWLALAATLVLVAAGAFWVFAPPRDQRASVAENQPPTALRPPEPTPAPSPGQPTIPSPAAPRIFAVSISPVTVRSTAERPSVIIPAGIDVLALNLEGGPDSRTRVGGRATIRAVSGDEIWQGPAAAGGDLPPGVVARIDVPAARLPVDDYVVTLFGTDAAGAEQEWSRYFLRVRAP